MFTFLVWSFIGLAISKLIAIVIAIILVFNEEGAIMLPKNWETAIRTVKTITAFISAIGWVCILIGGIGCAIQLV